MRVATVDGLVTLFYDGTKELWNRELYTEWLYARNMRRRYSNRDVKEDSIESLDVSDDCKRYLRERLSWQQIIIVEGVTEIPECTFYGCWNIQRVILADTIIRIQRMAFYRCENLVFIKWSLRLQYIGDEAFEDCNLSSVFIPPRCREIADEVFSSNMNLSILNVPQEVELGRNIINGTALAKTAPFRTDTEGWYDLTANDYMNQWLKHINNDENFALHRACASFNPLKQVINVIVQEKGLKAFKEENSIGINPSRYLKENPYTELTEKEIIHDYLMKMMGEVE